MKTLGRAVTPQVRRDAGSRLPALEVVLRVDTAGRAAGVRDGACVTAIVGIIW